MSKTVAIVGFSRTMVDAPFEDKEIDIWCMNEGYVMPEITRCDRWFQMHDRKQWERPGGEDAAYVDWLKTTCDKPVYFFENEPDIPTAVLYPLGDVLAQFGKYMTCSACYMIALAIIEGFQEIQLFGIDCSSETEYVVERAGIEHLLGVAQGMGIKVTLPDSCPMLKSPLYGLEEWETNPPILVRGAHEGRLFDLERQRKLQQANLNMTEGRIAETLQWLETYQIAEMSGRPIVVEGEIVEPMAPKRTPTKEALTPVKTFQLNQKMTSRLNEAYNGYLGASAAAQAAVNIVQNLQNEYNKQLESTIDFLAIELKPTEEINVDFRTGKLTISPQQQKPGFIPAQQLRATPEEVSALLSEAPVHSDAELVSAGSTNGKDHS